MIHGVGSNDRWAVEISAEKYWQREYLVQI